MSPAPLTNWQTAEADRIGALAARYRRASREAAEAALAAGEALAAARAECRHGQWLPFLRRAGIAERTARNWMRLAAAELSVAAVVEAGGVRAALLALANPPAVAIVERQVEDLPDPAGVPAEAAPEPEIGHGGRSADPESAPVAHGTGPAGTGPPDVRETARPAPPSGSERWISPTRGPDPAQAALARAMGEHAALTPAQRRRADKAARGECLDCPEPAAEGRVRCDGCTDRRRDENAARTARARLGRELEPRIAEAARTGRGLRLTAADVAALVPSTRRRDP